MPDKKKRNKFNILDTIFVLVLLLILVYGIFVNNKGVEKSEREIPVTIVLEVKSLDRDMYDGLKEDIEVVDHIQNLDFGALGKFEIKESTTQVENKIEGKYVMSKIPDKYDALMEISVDAKLSGMKLVKNKTDLKIGERLTVKIANIAFSGTIISVDYDENLYKELISGVR